MLRIFKPRSILQLTIAGFLVVAGLLTAALIVTLDQLDGLSNRSQQVVLQSASALRSSRILIEQTTAMERNIKQYNILNDEEILKVYAERRTTFSDAARQLADMQLNTEISTFAQNLLDTEMQAYQFIANSVVNDEVVELYDRLLDIAYEISRATNTWTNQELANLQRETADSRNILTMQALVFVGAALFLGAVFTALITRPLMQIDKAIKVLGSGSYETPVAIHGPTDLVSLGERLDWLRSRLNKLEQQRSSFLRHVSHELKTPLAAIQESSSLLSDGIVGVLTEEQQEIIRIQGNNCQRLQRLIRDLLRHNSDSFSVLNAMPQHLRLDRVIMEVISVHELSLKSASIIVEKQLEKITVQGNGEQLRVIIDNLFTNAIRFSPPDGIITLKLYQQGNSVIFEIFDQGPGIRQEEVEKIFEAFYQGEMPDKSPYIGTGLGLAIAEEYAAANGGSIEAVPSTQGGHFRLLLPISPQGRQEDS